MKIAVLGAAGQLGGAVLEAARQRHDVAGFRRADLDVTDSAALARTLTAAGPDCIINCSAFANVDAAEDAPTAAIAVNALAVRSLARVATELNAVLVHYSTDFVLDGLTPGLHDETHRPNPSGAYASSKLLGEWFAAETPRHYILRVESLFGGAKPKSSIDMLLDGILSGRTVTAFSDRTVSPSYVLDVADATLRMIEQRIPFGLYHCVNTGSTTWDALTRELARLAGSADAEIATAQMAKMAMRVRRPLNAAMSNEKLRAAGIDMPTWQDALARHVHRRLAKESR